MELSLNENESFTWSATNKSGQTSSFEGTYKVGTGTLTLVRSNDNQQLAGNMTTQNNNTFSFRLAGQQAATLNFVRG